jgi:hypothetical protein
MLAGISVRVSTKIQLRFCASALVEHTEYSQARIAQGTSQQIANNTTGTTLWFVLEAWFSL